MKPPNVPPIIAINALVGASPILSPDVSEAVNKPKPAAQAISTHAEPDWNIKPTPWFSVQQVPTMKPAAIQPPIGPQQLTILPHASLIIKGNINAPAKVAIIFCIVIR